MWLGNNTIASAFPYNWPYLVSLPQDYWNTKLNRENKLHFISFHNLFYFPLHSLPFPSKTIYLPIKLTFAGDFSGDDIAFGIFVGELLGECFTGEDSVSVDSRDGGSFVSQEDPEWLAEVKPRVSDPEDSITDSKFSSSSESETKN